MKVVTSQRLMNIFYHYLAVTRIDLALGYIAKSNDTSGPYFLMQINSLHQIHLHSQRV